MPGAPRPPMSMAPPPVIQVSGIRKTYGRVVAVDDVSFEVRQGEIFGLIGPNGAGKTTTMECVEGLRRPDRGSISVLSLDPVSDARALQQRMGVQLQQAQLQKRIKVWEAVDLWASLYPRPVDGNALRMEIRPGPTQSPIQSERSLHFPEDVSPFPKHFILF
jgi:ABC-2 type transport system ATP-binding protein